MTDAYRVRVSPRNAKELRGALAMLDAGANRQGVADGLAAIQGPRS